jgi:hypothetical protein
MAHLMFRTPLGTVWGANLVDCSNGVSEMFPGDGPNLGRRIERDADVVPEFFLIRSVNTGVRGCHEN